MHDYGVNVISIERNGSLLATGSVVVQRDLACYVLKAS